ncbi:hypothetical protein JCM6882_002656 [Rhodosporidiobolus microsporus]
MKRTATPGKAGSQAAAAMAAPAWRQFSFFGSTSYPFSSGSSGSTSPLLAHPASISTLHSAPTLGDNGVVLLADLDGRLHLLNEQWEAERSWTAYEGGRVQWVETSSWDYRKGRVIVVTVGDDRSTAFPVLKVWLLTLPLASTAAVAAASSSIPTPPPEAHLTLLRSTPISPTPSRPAPVSSLALAPSLSHIIVGLADGSVIGWKRVDELIETSLNELEDAAARAAEPPVASSGGGRGKAAERPRPFVVGGLGKLRALWDGNKEPVTNVGVTASPPSSLSASGLQTLFILTTSQILSLPLPSSTYPHANRYKHATPTVLDEHGAAVGCAKVLRLSVPGEEEGGAQERMVVAREEAIYVYGGEGREGCWAYEGPKSSIVALTTTSAFSTPPSTSSRLPTPYLAILTPPQRSTLASHSATIRAHATSSRSTPAPPSASSTPAPEEKVGKVTVFDPENKFVAFSKPFGDAVGEGEAGVREVLEAWGAVWVLTEGGKLYRLTEQPLSSSLSQLYQRNLYTLAVSLAQSRGLPDSDVAEIYRRYGDHLYSKADYEGAMSCYLKTVGVVQASYVIRKFLDAQRLTHLTSYLQELHSRSLANSDITTLLLNCYTKLGDDSALERFIHSSSASSHPSSSADADTKQEPPFDLETAIRVLRQASYFSYAASLASRYNLHGEYLRIAIEDEGDVRGALSHVQELARGEKGGNDGEGKEEAKEAMRKWAGVLLSKEPEATTDVLVEICCGPEVGEEKPQQVNGTKGRVADLQAGSRRGSMTNGTSGGYDVPGSSAPHPPTTAVPGSSSSPAMSSSASFTAEPDPVDSPADLPSPRLFFPHFVDHPRQFVLFLESIAQRRYGKSVDSLPSPPTDGPLPEPRSPDDAGAEDGFLDFGGFVEDTRKTDEAVVWNTLLELYVSPPPSRGADGVSSNGGDGGQDVQQLAQLRSKAMKLLRAERGELPLDATQALLVCTAKGYEEGFVALYEMEGRYEEIVRYYIDASLSSPSSSAHSTRLITSLRRYGPSQPTLYPLVLRHLTSTASLLSRHQADVLDLLDEVDEKGAMVPIEVVRVLSEGGVAGLGIVREYLKKQLTREKEEIDSDLALITSYRTETVKKRAEIRELADPTQPRVFQVTRCAACGGTLEAPMAHFMCKHSYHQRCLGENESQCPNCALTHGVVHEIQRSKAQLAGRHDLFLQEVHEADDGFKAMAAAFGRGAMSAAEATAGAA